MFLHGRPAPFGCKNLKGYFGGGFKESQAACLEIFHTKYILSQGRHLCGWGAAAEFSLREGGAAIFNK